MIRKSGWLIFLILVALVLALVYLLAGPGIRWGLVYSLEKAVGAEVNIARVSVRLAPLALQIDDLQITDRHQPTHNTLSFTRSRAALELWPALLGYTVINDLSVDGLAFGTERRRPGKVYRRERDPDDPGESLDLAAMLQLDLPNAEELMARANLLLPGRGDALQQQASAEQQRLQDLRQQLPDRERLAKLEADIQALTESRVENAAELAAKTEQLRGLQDQLRRERDALREVQRQLGQSREQLQQSLAGLREAHAADWQQLQQLANIRDGGLAPITEILLGDLWGERVAQLESLYRLVRPYIPESFGGDAADPAPVLPNRILPLPRQPYPNFWVKEARVHWMVGGGQATVSAQDITAQHRIIDAATRFSVDVQGLPTLAALQVHGDLRILEQMVTNLSWQMQGLVLDSLRLGRGDTALQLAQGLLATDGTVQLVDNRVAQQAQVRLTQALFDGASNRFMQQLTELLNQQSQIPLTLSAKGLVSRPEVSVRSPLDQIIADALLGEVKEKAAQLQAQLRSNLDAQLQQQLSGQGDWLATLDRQDGEAAELDARIESALNAKLGDLRDDARDRVRDNLRDRLGR